MKNIMVPFLKLSKIRKYVHIKVILKKKNSRIMITMVMMNDKKMINPKTKIMAIQDLKV